MTNSSEPENIFTLCAYSNTWCSKITIPNRSDPLVKVHQVHWKQGKQRKPLPIGKLGCTHWQFLFRKQLGLWKSQLHINY